MWPAAPLPIMTPDGKQLWYSKDPNPIDKSNRQDWIRAGGSAKAFEKYRDKEVAA